MNEDIRSKWNSNKENAELANIGKDQLSKFERAKEYLYGQNTISRLKQYSDTKNSNQDLEHNLVEKMTNLNILAEYGIYLDEDQLITK